MTKLELTEQVLNLLHNNSKKEMINKVWNNVMFCGESKATNFVECLISSDIKKASTKFNKEELIELIDILKLDEEIEEQTNEKLFNNLKEGFESVTEDTHLNIKPSVEIIRNFVDTLPKDLLKTLFFEKENTINIAKSLNKCNINNDTFYKLFVLNIGFKLESLNLT